MPRPKNAARTGVLTLLGVGGWDGFSALPRKRFGAILLCGAWLYFDGGICIVVYLCWLVLLACGCGATCSVGTG